MEDTPDDVGSSPVPDDDTEQPQDAFDAEAPEETSSQAPPPETVEETVEQQPEPIEEAASFEEAAEAREEEPAEQQETEPTTESQQAIVEETAPVEELAEAHEEEPVAQDEEAEATPEEPSATEGSEPDIAAAFTAAIHGEEQPSDEPEPEPEPVAEVELPDVPAASVEASPELAAAVDEAFESVDVTEEEEDQSFLDWQPGEWFVVHTYAGYENKVKTNLLSRISSMNMEEKIYEVVIPTEDVMEVKSGKKQVVQRKVFPGYLLVRMDLDDDSWYVVRNTPGVTGFVGSGTKPIPLSDKEVDRVLQRKAAGVEERPKPRLEFTNGDNVRVVTGPFANFQGIISEIDVDRSKLKVLVNIFGRETPVELGFDQVAKV